MTRKIIAIALACGLLVSCSAKKDNEQNPASSQKNAPRVRVMGIKKQTIARVVEYSANLKAFEESNLAPSIPGKITRIMVAVGDRVRKGQLLVLMDNSKYQQALLQYNDLKSDYRRYDTVHKAGVISEQNFEKTKMSLNVAKTNLDYLKENTEIIAPFDGVITARFFEDGEIFLGSPNSATGKVGILTIMQMDPMKALLDISELFYNQVDVGMKVKFQSDIFPGETFEGSVIKKYPTIDEASRTFRVEVKVPNAQYKLRPGMYCKAELYLGMVDAYVVPSSVVLKQAGTNERYVFTYSNGIARRVVVSVGKRFNEMVEIISPEINANSQLIYQGHVNLNDQMAVEVVQ